MYFEDGIVRKNNSAKRREAMLKVNMGEIPVMAGLSCPQVPLVVCGQWLTQTAYGEGPTGHVLQHMREHADLPPSQSAPLV